MKCKCNAGVDMGDSRVAQNLTGLRFGKLIVISFNGKKGRSRVWNCLCDCGKESVVSGGNLKNGHTKSCGCLQQESIRRLGKSSRSHGLSRHRIRNIYNMMKDRCHNPKGVSYHLYGGRGIAVCARWSDSFLHFVEDMGLPPSNKHQIDRIDNNGGYEPNNCRWATPKEQSRNRRTNHILRYNGKELPVSAWAEESGIPVGTLYARLRAGWSVEKMIATPVRPVTRSNTD